MTPSSTLNKTRSRSLLTATVARYTRTPVHQNNHERNPLQRRFILIWYVERVDQLNDQLRLMRETSEPDSSYTTRWDLALTLNAGGRFHRIHSRVDQLLDALH